MRTDGQTDIEKLLIDLIKISSVSGEEKEIGDFVFKKLKDVGGFRLEKQMVDKERFNVVARKGRSKIWIVAHLDTVPGEVKLRVTGTHIYGRGSTDNKASVAGAIMAARQLDNINLLFTIGEEKDFCGAKLAQKIVGRSRAVVMEATRFEIFTSQRGVIDFLLQAKGIQKHSSLIEDINENAFHRLIDAINGLIHKKWTAFNVGLMAGGVAVNIVAGRAEAKISARPETQEEYHRILKELKELDKTKSVQVKILCGIKPFESSLRIKGKRKKAFTEMAFFPNSLLFGGGDLDIAHSANENIKRSDLNRLPEELIKAVRILEAL